MKSKSPTWSSGSYHMYVNIIFALTLSFTLLTRNVHVFYNIFVTRMYFIFFQYYFYFTLLTRNVHVFYNIFVTRMYFIFFQYYFYFHFHILLFSGVKLSHCDRFPPPKQKFVPNFNTNHHCNIYKMYNIDVISASNYHLNMYM